MPKKTQKERVLMYMKSYGSITSLDAFRDLGITRLAAVICDLSKEGYDFNRSYESCPNRFGEQVHFMRYSLRRGD